MALHQMENWPKIRIQYLFPTVAADVYEPSVYEKLRTVPNKKLLIAEAVTDFLKHPADILNKYPFYAFHVENMQRLHSNSFRSVAGQIEAVNAIARVLRSEIKVGDQDIKFGVSDLRNNIVALYLTTDRFTKDAPEPDLLAGNTRIYPSSEALDRITNNIMPRVRAQLEELRNRGKQGRAATGETWAQYAREAEDFDIRNYANRPTDEDDTERGR